jgi:hypothetical protein
MQGQFTGASVFVGTNALNLTTGAGIIAELNPYLGGGITHEIEAPDKENLLMLGDYWVASAQSTNLAVTFYTV